MQPGVSLFDGSGGGFMHMLSSSCLCAPRRAGIQAGINASKCTAGQIIFFLVLHHPLSSSTVVPGYRCVGWADEIVNNRKVDTPTAVEQQ